MSKRALYVFVLIILLVPMSLWVSSLVQAAGTGESSSKVDSPTAATDLRKLVTVSGEGKVFTPSDEATINFAVRTIRKTAKDAMTDNSITIDKVISALSSKGLTKDEIKTGNISLYPQEVWQENKAPKIVSYTAENRVIVKTKKLEQLGGFIDVATASGANEVSGLTFQLSDDNPARNDALRIATKNARKKAQVLAKELDLSLGKAIIVNEGSNPGPIIPYNRDDVLILNESRAEKSMAPPVLPQDIQVNAIVTISFEIK